MVANQLWWIVIGEIEIRGSFIVCDGNVVYNGLLWEGQSWDDGLWSWSGVGVELGWSLELELECGWSWRGSGGARCLIVLVGVTCFCWISWFQEPQSVTSWACGPSRVVPGDMSSHGQLIACFELAKARPWDMSSHGVAIGRR